MAFATVRRRGSAAVGARGTQPASYPGLVTRADIIKAPCNLAVALMTVRLWFVTALLLLFTRCTMANAAVPLADDAVPLAIADAPDDGVPRVSVGGGSLALDQLGPMSEW